MKNVLIAVIFMFTVASLVLTYAYYQRYNQNSSITAISGIVFNKTLNLEAYKRVSSGFSVFGTYDNYSRSDRHNETVKVYCNDYCVK